METRFTRNERLASFTMGQRFQYEAEALIYEINLEIQIPPKYCLKLAGLHNQIRGWW